MAATTERQLLWVSDQKDIGDSQIEIEAHKDAVFETDVTGYELLGSEVLLYFNVAGTAMTAKS